jgi:hypothetical protein
MSGQMTTLKLSSRCGLGIGTLLGLLLCGAAWNSRIHFSRRSIYDQIHVGMTREKVAKLLRTDGVECGLTETAENSQVCHFSDFWHSYLVAMDSKVNRVGRLQITEAPPIRPLELLRSIHRRQPEPQP